MNRLAGVVALLSMFSLGVLHPGALRGQGLKGTVLYTDDTPVTGAIVELLDEGRQQVAVGVSDQDGYFEVAAGSPGSYWVRVRHISADEMVEGPVDLVSDYALVMLHVVRRPIPLDSLEVFVEARAVRLESVGFYRRQENSGGLFITPEDIEERPYERPSDFFRTIPGVTIVEGREAGSIGNYPVTNYSLRTNLNPGSMCWPRIYVDGIVVDQGGQVMPLGSFDNLVRTYDLVAIEVYNSPAVVPIEFGGATGGRCGVYLLWTKTGRSRR